MPLKIRTRRSVNDLQISLCQVYNYINQSNDLMTKTTARKCFSDLYFATQHAGLKIEAMPVSRDTDYVAEYTNLFERYKQHCQTIGERGTSSTQFRKQKKIIQKYQKADKNISKKSVYYAVNQIALSGLIHELSQEWCQAAIDGDRWLMKIMQACDLSIHTENTDGWTAVRFAVQHKHFKIMKDIVEVALANDEFITCVAPALGDIVKHSNHRIFKWLLNKADKAALLKRLIMETECEQGLHTILTALVNNTDDAEGFDKLQTLLNKARHVNCLLPLLLKKSVYQKSALYFAAFHKNVIYIDTLLNYADDNHHRVEMLSAAIEDATPENISEIVELLLERFHINCFELNFWDYFSGVFTPKDPAKHQAVNDAFREHFDDMGIFKESSEQFKPVASGMNLFTTAAPITKSDAAAEVLVHSQLLLQSTVIVSFTLNIGLALVASLIHFANASSHTPSLGLSCMPLEIV